jgi:hypothetical protein
VSRASFKVFVVSAALIVASVLGAGFPDGP